MRVLLVNPPVYDFTAYDFWVRPYGLLRTAGALRGRADMALFDYLDRLHPHAAALKACASDAWGRGAYPSEKIARPDAYKDIPRYYRRFGLPRSLFLEFLRARGITVRI